MPLSYVLYTNQTGTGPFNITFPYISLDHIKVEKNGVLLSLASPQQYSISTSPTPRVTLFNSVAMTPADTLRIYRQTPGLSAAPNNQPLVDFTDGSVLTASDLDKNTLQLLYLVQESDDTGSGALPTTFDDLRWDAQSKRIINLAAPTSAADAVTKAYVDGITLYGSSVGVPQSWTFSGTGSQTQFQLSSPSPAQTDANLFLVEVSGVIQRPTSSYTISSSGLLTFTEPPSLGTDNVVVRNWGVVRNVAAFNDNLSVNANFTVDGGVFSVDAAANTVTTTVDPTFNGVVIGKGANSSVNPSLIIGSGNPSSGTSGNGANVAIGHGAHDAATTGANNTAVGSAAAGSLTTGSNTVAIGRNAAASITTGTGNTAIGADALPNANSAANYNVAVGQNAGSTTVNYNANRPLQSVYIGYEARGAADDANTIVIGSFATSLGANTTVIGTTSTVSTTFPGGTLSIPGGGIVFPTTQVPSADPNTLDDYEEGTWTPVIRGSTTPGTFTTTATGSYTKIGRLVHVQVDILVTAVSGTAAAGALEITGFPFTASTANSTYGPFLLYHFGIAGSKNYSAISITSGSAVFSGAGGHIGVDGTQSDVLAANVGINDRIRFAATIPVS